MSRIVLVLRDLYPARLSEAASAALPRLPELERWLRSGSTEFTASDWRQWLQRQWVGGGFHAVPPAAVAGATIAGLPAGHAVWFATPVHFVAGLDTLRVHPAGLLTLEIEEQQILALDFARVFAGSGWTLHARGRRELLLTGAAGGAAPAGEDPAMWLGADPAAGLPAGEGAAPLRRLGAELEMWLHEHPVNKARIQRGVLNANALWLWGGGMSVAVNAAAIPTAPAAIAWADDLFVDGLGRLTGTDVRPLPQRWPDTLNTSGDLLAVCGVGALPDMHSLRSLEQQWIAPALRYWQSGGCDSAILLAGNRAVTLTRAVRWQLWRVLRRLRPWWETLL